MTTATTTYCHLLTTAFLVVSLFTTVSDGFTLRVYMPSGQPVDIPNVRSSMKAKELRPLLSKHVTNPDDKPFAMSVTLCRPSVPFSIKPTPILPLDPEKTLEDQGVYAIFSNTIVLPQYWFPFKVLDNEEKPLVMTGCSWMTPEEVLKLSMGAYREFKEDMGKKEEEKAPATKDKKSNEEEVDRQNKRGGPNRNAYKSLQEAEAAEQKIPVVSSRSLTVTFSYAPDKHEIRPIFTYTGKDISKATVRDLRKSMVEAMMAKEPHSKRLALSIPVCHPRPTRESYLLQDHQLLSDVFGPDVLDFSLFSPAQFVRVIIGKRSYDLPVCPNMTRVDFERQVRTRFGLKDTTSVILISPELIMTGKTIGGRYKFLPDFYFAHGQSPTYRIRLKEFKPHQLLEGLDYEDEPEAGQKDKSKDAGKTPKGENPLERVARLISAGGKKVLADRRIIIAILVVVFGLVLIVLGISSSTSADAQAEETQVYDSYVVDRAAKAQPEGPGQQPFTAQPQPYLLAEINEPVSSKVLLFSEDDDDDDKSGGDNDDGNNARDSDRDDSRSELSGTSDDILPDIPDEGITTESDLGDDEPEDSRREQ